MPAIKTDKDLKRRGIVFFSVLGAILIIFLIAFIVVLSRFNDFKSYEKIARKGYVIEGNKLFTLSAGDYYVFIYSSEDTGRYNVEKQEELESHIVNYFNFYKQNKHQYESEMAPMMLMDIADPVNKRCLSSYNVLTAQSWLDFYIDETSVPMLLYFENTQSGNAINYQYTVYKTATEIEKKLYNSISFIPVAYIPNKDEDYIVEL